MGYIGTQKHGKQCQKPANKRYKHCTAEEAETFERNSGIIRGNVHTAAYHAPGHIFYKAAPIMPNRKKMDVKVIERCGALGTSFKFNPKDYVGECYNMGNYKTALNRVLMQMSMEKVPTLTRLDFKIDCNPPPELGMFWDKLNDLFVYAFMAYKKIQPKGRERTTDPITGQFKQTKGTTRGYEFAYYNKAIQKPEEGVARRTELRCLRLNTKAGARACDEWDAIDKLKTIVAAIPAYYEAAVSGQYKHLCMEYIKTEPTEGTRSPGEFLRAHADCVFSWEQIKEFASFVGVRDAAKFAHNFTQRNPFVVLIDQSDLVKLCAVIIDLLERYEVE